MKQPRMISVISFPRNNSSISPEEVTYIESADASDIAPEKFIASIVVCHAKRKKLTSKIQKNPPEKNFLADLKHI